MWAIPKCSSVKARQRGRYLLHRFLPVTVWGPRLTPRIAFNDIIGGFIVGVMIVPSALSYASLANLPLTCGLMAALFGAFSYGSLGQCAVLAVGPVAELTTLLISISSIPEEKRMATYQLLGVEVGILAVALSFVDGGKIIKTIFAKAVGDGYTCAAAILAIAVQIKVMFNLQIETTTQLHDVLRTTIDALIRQFSLKKVYCFMLFCLYCGYLILIKRVRRLPLWIPHQLLVVIVSILITRVARLDKVLDLDIVRSVPSQISPPRLPRVENLLDLAPYTLAITIISFVQMYVIAKRVMPGIEPNTELFANGVTNFVANIFGGMPVTNSFSCSAVLIDQGVTTPLTSYAAASVVLLTIVGLTRLNVFYYLPRETLAAIVVSSVWRLVDFAEPLTLWRQENRMDAVVWGFTFLLTVFAGITVGVLCGIALSLVLVVLRVARPRAVSVGFNMTTLRYGDLSKDPELLVYPHILMWRFDAPLYFINTGWFQEKLVRAVQDEVRPISIIIVTCSKMVDMDAAALCSLPHMLKSVATLSPEHPRHVFLTAMQGRVERMVFASGVLPPYITEEYDRMDVAEIAATGRFPVIFRSLEDCIVFAQRCIRAMHETSVVDAAPYPNVAFVTDAVVAAAAKLRSTECGSLAHRHEEDRRYGSGGTHRIACYTSGNSSSCHNRSDNSDQTRTHRATKLAGRLLTYSARHAGSAREGSATGVSVDANPQEDMGSADVNAHPNRSGRSISKNDNNDHSDDSDSSAAGNDAGVGMYSNSSLCTSVGTGEDHLIDHLKKLKRISRYTPNRELIGVIGLVRHTELTPKQKKKFYFDDPTLLQLAFAPHSHAARTPGSPPRHGNRTRRSVEELEGFFAAVETGLQRYRLRRNAGDWRRVLAIVRSRPEGLTIQIKPVVGSRVQHVILDHTVSEVRFSPPRRNEYADAVPAHSPTTPQDCSVEEDDDDEKDLVHGATQNGKTHSHRYRSSTNSDARLQSQDVYHGNDDEEGEEGDGDAALTAHDAHNPRSFSPMPSNCRRAGATTAHGPNQSILQSSTLRRPNDLTSTLSSPAHAFPRLYAPSSSSGTLPIKGAMMVVKWGGVLTHSGIAQARVLGEKLFARFFAAGDLPLHRLLEFARLVSVTAADEDRVIMTALAVMHALMQSRALRASDIHVDDGLMKTLSAPARRLLDDEYDHFERILHIHSHAAARHFFHIPGFRRLLALPATWRMPDEAPFEAAGNADARHEACHVHHSRGDVSQCAIHRTHGGAMHGANGSMSAPLFSHYVDSAVPPVAVPAAHTRESLSITPVPVPSSAASAQPTAHSLLSSAPERACSPRAASKPSYLTPLQVLQELERCMDTIVRAPLPGYVLNVPLHNHESLRELRGRYAVMLSNYQGAKQRVPKCGGGGNGEDGGGSAGRNSVRPTWQTTQALCSHMNGCAAQTTTITSPSNNDCANDSNDAYDGNRHGGEVEIIRGRAGDVCEVSRRKERNPPCSEDMSAMQIPPALSTLAPLRTNGRGTTPPPAAPAAPPPPANVSPSAPHYDVSDAAKIRDYASYDMAYNVPLLHAMYQTTQLHALAALTRALQQVRAIAESLSQIGENVLEGVNSSKRFIIGSLVSGALMQRIYDDFCDFAQIDERCMRRRLLRRAQQMYMDAHGGVGQEWRQAVQFLRRLTRRRGKRGAEGAAGDRTRATARANAVHAAPTKSTASQPRTGASNRRAAQDAAATTTAAPVTSKARGGGSENQSAICSHAQSQHGPTYSHRDRRVHCNNGNTSGEDSSEDYEDTDTEMDDDDSGGTRDSESASTAVPMRDRQHYPFVTLPSERSCQATSSSSQPESPRRGDRPSQRARDRPRTRFYFSSYHHVEGVRHCLFESDAIHGFCTPSEEDVEASMLFYMRHLIFKVFRRRHLSFTESDAVAAMTRMQLLFRSHVNYRVQQRQLCEDLSALYHAMYYVSMEVYYSVGDGSSHARASTAMPMFTMTQTHSTQGTRNDVGAMRNSESTTTTAVTAAAASASSSAATTTNDRNQDTGNIFAATTQTAISPTPTTSASRAVTTTPMTALSIQVLPPSERAGLSLNSEAVCSPLIRQQQQQQEESSGVAWEWGGCHALARPSMNTEDCDDEAAGRSGRLPCVQKIEAADDTSAQPQRRPHTQRKRSSNSSSSDSNSSMTRCSGTGAQASRTPKPRSPLRYESGAFDERSVLEQPSLVVVPPCEHLGAAAHPSAPTSPLAATRISAPSTPAHSSTLHHRPCNREGSVLIMATPPAGLQTAHMQQIRDRVSDVTSMRRIHEGISLDDFSRLIAEVKSAIQSQTLA